MACPQTASRRWQHSRRRHLLEPPVRRLGRAHARRPVHRHQAELRRVADVPFPVVDQGPGEVAADPRAGLHGALHRLQVAAQVLAAEAVVDHRRAAAERVRAAVLGDQHRRIAIVAADHLQHLDQARRVDLAAEGVQFRALRAAADGDVAGAGQVQLHIGRGVVVDAQEVDRLVDGLQVAVADVALQEVVHQRRIGPLQQRIQPGAVPQGVQAVGCRTVPEGQRAAGGTAGLQRLGRADPQVAVDARKSLDRQPLAQVHVVGGRPQQGDVLQPRRVLAQHVAEHRVHGRLVQGDEMLEAVAHPPGHGGGVVGEALGGVARAPAALVLQGLGQVPVEQGGVGRDPLGQARRRPGARSGPGPRR
jgi:hypothetical protein